MVGIILKNFFLSSHSKQFSFHRPMLTVCAHQTLPMKRSLCYFGEYPTQIVIIYHRLTILSFSHLASNWVAPPNSVYKISQANVSGLYIRTVVP